MPHSSETAERERDDCSSHEKRGRGDSASKIKGAGGLARRAVDDGRPEAFLIRGHSACVERDRLEDIARCL